MRKFRNRYGSLGAGILALFMLVVLVGCVVFFVVQNYNLDKEINGWLERAQVASNPTDMKLYLISCRDGMEKWELDDGYDAIIFETPENDMLLVTKALDRSIDRCYEIEKMNSSSPEYQTALDDLRGQLRELDIHATGRYWVKHWYVLPIGIIAIISFILSLAVAIRD